MATTKLNDLLSQVDEAYEVAQAKADLLEKTKAAQVKATAEARAVFDAVLAKHQTLVADAATTHEQARQALDTLSVQVNERLNAVTGRTDPRVNIK